MSKLTLTSLALLSLLFLGNTSDNYAAQSKQQPSQAPTGTVQKMIVENGSVTLNLDLNGLNGSDALVTRPVTLNFAAAANSFFPILVFNDLLRGPEPGSIALVPEIQPHPLLPVALAASFKQLVVEKLPSESAFDLAVRDGKTGFTFFNIRGHQYDYDPNAQSLNITGGNLLISQEFANALGRPSDAGAVVGKISIGAAMQPIQIDQLVNGETASVTMPSMQHALGSAVPNLVPGPDVIVGNVQDVDQMGNEGTQVGLAIGTDSCNNSQSIGSLYLKPIIQSSHKISIA
jgi:hypothetical protein